MDADKLLKSQNYNHEQMKQKLIQLDKTVKLARACGLNDVIEDVNHVIAIDPQSKGQNLGETIQKIKDQYRAKIRVNKAEVTKEVKLPKK